MNGESKYETSGLSTRNEASPSAQDPARQGAVRAFTALAKTPVRFVDSQLDKNGSSAAAATAGKIASSKSLVSRTQQQRSEPKLRALRRNRTRNQSQEDLPSMSNGQSSPILRVGKGSESPSKLSNTISPLIQSPQAASLLTTYDSGPGYTGSKQQGISNPFTPCPTPYDNMIAMGKAVQVLSGVEDDEGHSGTLNLPSPKSHSLDNRSWERSSSHTHANNLSTGNVVSTAASSTIFAYDHCKCICTQAILPRHPNDMSMHNLLGRQADVSTMPTPKLTSVSLAGQELKRKACESRNVSIGRLNSNRMTGECSNTSLFFTRRDMHTTVSSMADAIVASSLATSRAAIPPKVTRIEGRENYSLPDSLGCRIKNFESSSNIRKRCPATSLRETMRTTSKHENDGNGFLEGTRKRHLLGIKKHPNKHHEGDRKRWRHSVTELERKRYEAVWASNRGIYTLDADVVVNVVVKDIWSRSRLGIETLAELWDLVDRGGKGYLEREEFVAGLWLIDQRLKGRKLPMKLSESVWGSVGGLGGVKIRFG